MFMIQPVFTAVLLVTAVHAHPAPPVDIAIRPAAANPASPQMGDHLVIESMVTNNAPQPAQGLVTWMSLVEVTPGNETPVDLEDWSAQKAQTRALLAPHETARAQWRLRLIKAGDYRVAISATERNAPAIVSSPGFDFHVAQKPVISSRRVLPVAIGIPLMLAGLLAWQARRSR
jgi:hypothetical protein